jgi:hypothetical protein
MRIAKDSWPTGISDSLVLGPGHFGNLHHRSICRLVRPGLDSWLFTNVVSLRYLHDARISCLAPVKRPGT